MDKDGGVELLCCAPDWLKRGVVEIQSVDAPEMLIFVNVSSDLRATQSELAHRTLQLLRRQTGKAFGMIANNISNVIIQPPREIEGMVRFCPITEHHRDSREDLYRNF